ncbi:MAG TPA: Minf_1886 family protein, partial [Gemmatimonadales bacterium]|nr:Minf_1886 family protein [Gemmatimonadales bacterium]
ASAVLTHWGIHTTEDFGQIVFILIDVGLLAQQPTDRLEDFERVYEFAEVFKAGAGYRWPGVSSSG